MSEALPGVEPLVSPPPSFDAAAAARIAERHFDKRGTVSELGGERDQNFRVTTDDGDAFVLKISNPADDADDLDLQTEALRHVADVAPDLPVMRVVPAVDGSPWVSVDDGDTTYHVRMFTHLPDGGASAAAMDDDALFELGATVARVGEALRGFFHPNARYDILWDLRHTPDLRAALDDIPDGRRRDHAERVFDRFDDRVAPAFETLRAQVVHNDLTLDNVLLGDDGRVSGIVDFGDLTHTALVCDLAIALASVMYRRDDPLEAAAVVTRGYVSVTPLEDEEARILGDLVAARVASWGTIVAWRAENHPEKVGHTAVGVDDGWALLDTLVGTGLDAVGRRLRTAALASETPYPRMETDELLSRRRRVLGPSPLTYDDPVHFVAGDGAWLFDPAGRRYLDAYNNVQVVGHGNPVVADAIAGQAHKLATNTRYLHESIVTLGERLLETMPDGMDRVLLVNSGSEANDVAWRLATAATGHEGGVVSDRAYHGITEATVALSPSDWLDGNAPDHVETVPPPAADARPAGGVDPVERTADALATLDERGYAPAAFVFDSMFTSDGIFPPDGRRLGEMADRIHDAGGLVVADEVQSGYGRTGADMWGFRATDVEPDIVTLGKPMGNGHPVAAVVTRSDVAGSLMEDPGVFSTFGGNPVSSAAALAVLDVFDDRNLLAHTRDVGSYLGAGLADLAATHDVVGDVRRRGLMVGVELVRGGEGGAPAGDEATAVVNGLRRRRVLVGTTGEHGNVLKIRPPLVFERDHADRLLNALDEALSNLP
jgi:4-aminobutyrate aminotransferase-like enzyme/aminoglycoside phosphotransferase (APT) family kinase protein